MALELLGIAGPKSLFLNERGVRQEMSGEGTALWVRQLSVTLAQEISSLQLMKSFLWDEAGFGQYLVTSL